MRWDADEILETEGAPMNSYMVVCTFKKGTVMSDVYDVIAEEQAKAAELEKDG